MTKPDRGNQAGGGSGNVAIDEGDLDRIAGDPGSLPLPKPWRTTWTGEPQPDWVRILRRSRRGH
jgi:hypothetical protein